VIPVAILTTETFNASTVNPTTIHFGATGTEAAPVQSDLEDVDGDGDIDILHFKTNLLPLLRVTRACVSVGMVKTKQRPGSFRSRAFTSYRGGCHPVTLSEVSSLYYAPGTVPMSTNPSIVQEEPGSSDRIGSHRAF
jgi:hypothetical protein